MHRIDHATRLVDANGVGRDGFTEGSAVPPVAATVVTDAFLNAIQEEICRAIELLGGTLSSSNKEQLGTLLAVIQTLANGATQGPGSSADNRLTRFDGTTGKQVQSSVVGCDDSGNVTGVGNLQVLGTITLTGEVVYNAGKTRVIRLGLTGLTSVQSATVYHLLSGRTELRSDDASYYIDLAPYLTTGCSIDQIDVRVEPGSGSPTRSATGDRVRARLETSTGDNILTTVAAEATDDTTSLQTISLTALATTVNLATTRYVLSLEAGVDAATNHDSIYWIDVTVTDAGPRNF